MSPPKFCRLGGKRKDQGQLGHIRSSLSEATIRELLDLGFKDIRQISQIIGQVVASEGRSGYICMLPNRKDGVNVVGRPIVRH